MMFSSFCPCDFCPYYDDETICPLIKGGFQSDCVHFVSAIDLGGLEE